MITCTYDFTPTSSAGGNGALRQSQTCVHHYVLPDELRALLDSAGFTVEETCGGFDGEPFDEAESVHFVVVARQRRAAADSGSSPATPRAAI